MKLNKYEMYNYVYRFYVILNMYCIMNMGQGFTLTGYKYGSFSQAVNMSVETQ